jgi:hypothetical protein
LVYNKNRYPFPQKLQTITTKKHVFVVMKNLLSGSYIFSYNKKH